jgi:preprotein translocase subunit SecY
MVVPSLEELSKEGEYGREKINQYTRLITLPLAIVQSITVITLLKNQHLLLSASPINIITMMLTMLTGTMLIMWLGELLTEYGVGNGISLIIFAGIVSRLPVSAIKTISAATTDQTTTFIVFAVLALLVVAAVVVINEAERRVMIKYARRAQGSKSYGGETTFLPLKVNQAGMIPIIFAVSLVLFPSLIGKFLTGLPNPVMANIGQIMSTLFSPTNWFYNLAYFLMVIGFTYFYTAIVFDPQKIADQIKKNGGFIPGIRPGKPTASYLNFILTRITLAGAVFLGLIAILPNLARLAFDIQSLTIGGAGILIVVSVVLETAKQMESQLVMRSYEGFINS